MRKVVLLRALFVSFAAILIATNANANDDFKEAQERMKQRRAEQVEWAREKQKSGPSGWNQHGFYEYYPDPDGIGDCKYQEDYRTDEACLVCYNEADGERWESCDPCNGGCDHSLK